MSYKTALAKRTVGILFPLREKPETKPNTRDCNTSMQKVAPYLAGSAPSDSIDLSNGSKKGAAHGPRNGPVTLNASLNGTCAIMFVTNSSNVSHIPNKLATYLGLKTATVAGSFHVNGVRVQKEVRLLQESVECKLVGSNIAFQLKANRCIVSDLDRLQVCVEALPIGNLKVKMGDGTTKGPKNSPLAIMQTGRGGGGGHEVSAIATMNDKKNAVKETFKVGVGVEDQGEEVEVGALNDGMELRIILEGDSKDVCGYCAVRFPGMLKCPLSTTRYCSKACQKLDWPLHKKTLEKAKK